MSTLGDLLVEQGPYTQDLLFGPGFAGPLRWVRAVDLNALRDELIDLRSAAAAPGVQCREDTWSWEHFNQDQVDGYWIRCTLWGPHDEHKDEHTGLTWISQPEPATAAAPEGGETR